MPYLLYSLILIRLDYNEHKKCKPTENCSFSPWLPIRRRDTGPRRGYLLASPARFYTNPLPGLQLPLSSRTFCCWGCLPFLLVVDCAFSSCGWYLNYDVYYHFQKNFFRKICSVLVLSWEVKVLFSILNTRGRSCFLLEWWFFVFCFLFSFPLPLHQPYPHPPQNSWSVLNTNSKSASSEFSLFSVQVNVWDFHLYKNKMKMHDD